AIALRLVDGKRPAQLGAAAPALGVEPHRVGCEADGPGEPAQQAARATGLVGDEARFMHQFPEPDPGAAADPALARPRPAGAGLHTDEPAMRALVLAVDGQGPGVGARFVLRAGFGAPDR